MTSSDKHRKDPAVAREAKLAQALRANLRRRKSGAPQKVAADPKGKTGEGD